jgi:hypothetical protein
MAARIVTSPPSSITEYVPGATAVPSTSWNGASAVPACDRPTMSIESDPFLERRHSTQLNDPLKSNVRSSSTRRLPEGSKEAATFRSAIS